LLNKIHALESIISGKEQNEHTWTDVNSLTNIDRFNSTSESICTSKLFSYRELYENKVKNSVIGHYEQNINLNQSLQSINLLKKNIQINTMLDTQKNLQI